MTIQQCQTITADEFDSEEYGTGAQSLPYLQVLNRQDAQQAGFFLSLDNAQKVGFQPSEDWVEHQVQFSSGSEQGYRSLTGRLVILRRTPLLMFARQGGGFLGAFDRDLYEPQRVILKTRYLVFLCNRNRKLLHDKPLQFTAKGSLCGSFGEHYNDFRQQMSQAYGKTRGDRFFALSLFAVLLEPVLKGKEAKSWVCSVKQHGVPTKENWQSFFLGYDAALKDKLLAEFDIHQDFGKIQRGDFEDPYAGVIAD